MPVHSYQDEKRLPNFSRIVPESSDSEQPLSQNPPQNSIDKTQKEQELKFVSFKNSQSAQVLLNHMPKFNIDMNVRDYIGKEKEDQESEKYNLPL